MKINSVTMENFLGYQFEKYEMSNIINLFCGKNGSGKSAIHDAIVLCLNPDQGARGITTKSGLKNTITDGAKTGTVALDLDGNEVIRSLKSGNYNNNSGPEKNEVLPFVLNAQKFAGLSNIERRQFLENMAGVSMEPHEIRGELIKRGCDEEYVDAILELTLAGFDGAQKEAAKRARNYKAEWKGVTNETWGEKKAEEWEPKFSVRKVRPDMTIEQMEEEVKRLEGIARRNGTPIKAKCPCCDESVVIMGESIYKAEDATLKPSDAVKKLEKMKLDLGAAKEEEEGERYKKKMANRASYVNKKVMSWLKIAEQLSPEGVPRLLFDKARGPVNFRLVKWSKVFGHIEVDAYGDITFNGRLYELCSESQKWICDSFLADAIAFKSGLKLLLIDRMDVLDVPNRGRFMKWLLKLAPDYDTVIVTATMKSAPQLPGVNSVWVGNP